MYQPLAWAFLLAAGTYAQSDASTCACNAANSPSTIVSTVTATSYLPSSSGGANSPNQTGGFPGAPATVTVTATPSGYSGSAGVSGAPSTVTVTATPSGYSASTVTVTASGSGNSPNSPNAPGSQSTVTVTSVETSTVSATATNSGNSPVGTGSAYTVTLTETSTVRESSTATGPGATGGTPASTLTITSVATVGTGKAVTLTLTSTETETKTETSTLTTSFGSTMQPTKHHGTSPFWSVPGQTGHPHPSGSGFGTGSGAVRPTGSGHVRPTGTGHRSGAPQHTTNSTSPEHTTTSHHFNHTVHPTGTGFPRLNTTSLFHPSGTGVGRQNHTVHPTGTGHPTLSFHPSGYTSLSPGNHTVRPSGTGFGGHHNHTVLPTGTGSVGHHNHTVLPTGTGSFGHHNHTVRPTGYTSSVSPANQTSSHVTSTSGAPKGTGLPYTFSHKPSNSSATTTRPLSATIVPVPTSTVSPTTPDNTTFPQKGIQVSNDTCFENGAGNHDNGNLTAGLNATNAYHCFSGPASNFPNSDQWISFNKMQDLWSDLGQTWCPSGALNTQNQTNMVFKAIQAVAEASLVDNRVILSQVIQESSGCVNVASTTSSDNSTHNAGLLQSHNGASFVGNNATEADQYASIVQMISDGVQGTHYKGATGGDGMVQKLDRYGDFFTAARAYVSGDAAVDADNLSNGGDSSSGSYCSDMANYLTGWDGTDRASNCSNFTGAAY